MSKEALKNTKIQNIIDKIESMPTKRYYLQIENREIVQINVQFYGLGCFYIKDSLPLCAQEKTFLEKLELIKNKKHNECSEIYKVSNEEFNKIKTKN